MADDTVTVSDADLAAMEKKVQAAEEAKKTQLFEQAKEAARKEMERDAELKRLAEEKAALELKLRAQEDEAAKAKAAQDAALNKMVEDRIAEELAKRKGIVNNNSTPFGQQSTSPPATGLARIGIDPARPNPEALKRIEEASNNAWKRRYGIVEPGDTV